MGEERQIRRSQRLKGAEKPTLVAGEKGQGDSLPKAPFFGQRSIGSDLQGLLPAKQPCFSRTWPLVRLTQEQGAGSRLVCTSQHQVLFLCVRKQIPSCSILWSNMIL